MNKQDVAERLVKPLSKTKTAQQMVEARTEIKREGIFSKFVVGNYGCDKCPKRFNCGTKTDGKGICTPRAEVFSNCILAGEKDILPLMKEQLALLLTELDMEYTRCIAFGGTMSNEFFRLNYLVMMLSERIKKADEGIKVSVTYDYFDEIRNAVKKRVELEGKTKDMPTVDLLDEKHE